MHYLHYQIEVILMLSIKQMQICNGLNSLSPFNNESKSRRNLCHGIFSFIVLFPERGVELRSRLTTWDCEKWFVWTLQRRLPFGYTWPIFVAIVLVWTDWLAGRTDGWLVCMSFISSSFFIQVALEARVWPDSAKFHHFGKMSKGFCNSFRVSFIFGIIWTYSC